MVHIDSTSFGKIVVDGKTYGDVLVIGERVLERELGRLHREYGTGHKIAEFELEMLLSEKPEVIIVGDGQVSALVVDEEIRRRVEGEGIELIVLPTPKAILEYNEVCGVKKVCALLHSTC